MRLRPEQKIGTYRIGGSDIRQVTSEEDLGVTVASSLKTREHTNKVCAAARGMLAAIRRSFAGLSKQAFQFLYASHVRSRLEYGGAAAFPCTKGEMHQLEQVQRAATRSVVGMVGLTYHQRLQALNLFPQRYRRTRGDLLYVRRILRGDMGPELMAHFPLRGESRTRGHSLTLLKQRPGALAAEFRLSRRAVNLWNALPAEVVEEDNEDIFKQRLDEFLAEGWLNERQ